jgi:hypothetical protein
MKPLKIFLLSVGLSACGPKPLPAAPNERPFSHLAYESTTNLVHACRNANLLADKARMRSLSDTQVVNYTCAMGAVNTELANRRPDPRSVAGCSAAGAVFQLEFTRRFPAHTTEDLIGRC